MFTMKTKRISLLEFLEIKDCAALKQSNIASSSNDNVFVVTINRQSLNVLCDMNTDGGGWTVSSIFFSKTKSDDGNFNANCLTGSDIVYTFGDLNFNTCSYHFLNDLTLFTSYSCAKVGSYLQYYLDICFACSGTTGLGYVTIVI